MKANNIYLWAVKSNLDVLQFKTTEQVMIFLSNHKTKEYSIINLDSGDFYSVEEFYKYIEKEK